MNAWVSKLKKKTIMLDKRTAFSFQETEVLAAPDLAQQPLSVTKTLLRGDDDKRKQLTKAAARSPAHQTLGELLRWFRQFTSCIDKAEPAEVLSSSTLYVFKQSSRFRIFCINVCRSGKYATLFRLIMLAFYIRLLVSHFQEAEISTNDTFSIIAGSCLYLNVSLQVVAYGFLGHRNSYLLRSPFNSIEFFLTICFFIPQMFFLQVLQLFRLFSLLENLRLISSFTSKSKIIRRSLLSLGTFAVLYLLLIFLFSLFSYLIYYSEMNKYCVDSLTLSDTFGVDLADTALDCK